MRRIGIDTTIASMGGQRVLSVTAGLAILFATIVSTVSLVYLKGDAKVRAESIAASFAREISIPLDQNDRNTIKMLGDGLLTQNDQIRSIAVYRSTDSQWLSPMYSKASPYFQGRDHFQSALPYSLINIFRQFFRFDPICTSQYKDANGKKVVSGQIMMTYYAHDHNEIAAFVMIVSGASCLFYIFCVYPLFLGIYRRLTAPFMRIHLESISFKKQAPIEGQAGMAEFKRVQKNLHKLKDQYASMRIAHDEAVTQRDYFRRTLSKRIQGQALSSHNRESMDSDISRRSQVILSNLILIAEHIESVGSLANRHEITEIKRGLKRLAPMMSRHPSDSSTSTNYCDVHYLISNLYESRVVFGESTRMQFVSDQAVSRFREVDYQTLFSTLLRVFNALNTLDLTESTVFVRIEESQEAISFHIQTRTAYSESSRRLRPVDILDEMTLIESISDSLVNDPISVECNQSPEGIVSISITALGVPGSSESSSLVEPSLESRKFLILSSNLSVNASLLSLYRSLGISCRSVTPSDLFAVAGASDTLLLTGIRESELTLIQRLREMSRIGQVVAMSDNTIPPEALNLSLNAADHQISLSTSLLQQLSSLSIIASTPGVRSISSRIPMQAAGKSPLTSLLESHRVETLSNTHVLFPVTLGDLRIGIEAALLNEGANVSYYRNLLEISKATFRAIGSSKVVIMLDLVTHETTEEEMSALEHLSEFTRIIGITASGSAQVNADLLSLVSHNIALPVETGYLTSIIVANN